VTLTNNTGATINFTGGGLAISTTGGTGFSATGGGTVNVTGTWQYDHQRWHRHGAERRQYQHRREWH
jgi:hypothetical protein